MPLGLITELIAKPIKCAVNGEKVNIDVAAVINPIRAVHNTVQMIQSDNDDKSNHVWIGRRCLGDQPFGLSFSPGVDVYHWAIGIEGYIYEIDVSHKQRWSIQHDNRVRSDYGKSFEWFRINEGSVRRSRKALCAYADSFSGQNYGHGLLIDAKKRNCQEFCSIMLANAMNVSLDRAALMIAVHVGTAIW
mmetsp:Transcript_28552/g.52177  ORF Transcript_28552/g.52177 Transcript_28552/m.52177 type:complete len:190 (+) Transcript_28552:53-622(+)